MEDYILEQELKDFDFSAIHPVKEKILGELLNMQRKTNSKRNKFNGLTKPLALDALDYVAAAGTDNIKYKKENM